MVKKRRRPAGTRQRALTGGRKRVLVVLFVPSVERDGATPNRPGALGRCGARDARPCVRRRHRLPQGEGGWRDDERGDVLVKDEPVVVHCYTTPADIQDDRNLADLGGFCRKMGREARQGEIGLVIGDEYFAIRDFGEE